MRSLLILVFLVIALLGLSAVLEPHCPEATNYQRFLNAFCAATTMLVGVAGFIGFQESKVNEPK